MGDTKEVGGPGPAPCSRGVDVTRVVSDPRLYL